MHANRPPGTDEVLFFKKLILKDEFLWILQVYFPIRIQHWYESIKDVADLCAAK